jgi:hypothetical protein
LGEIGAKGAKTALKNGKIMLGGVKGGFAKGAKSLGDIARRLGNKLRFNKFKIRRQGLRIQLLGHINPWVLLADGRVYEVDASEIPAAKLGDEVTTSVGKGRVIAEEAATRPAGTLSAPQQVTPINNKGFVQYGELDTLKRPTGAQAVITKDMIKTGSPAAQRITPPGFAGGGSNHARGHLIGNLLGGSGKDSRNLVTIIHNPVNTPIMRGFEKQIANAVKTGETVWYSVTPIYQGTNNLPIGITLFAKGSDGFELNLSLLNKT